MRTKQKYLIWAKQYKNWDVNCSMSKNRSVANRSKLNNCANLSKLWVFVCSKKHSEASWTRWCIWAVYLPSSSSSSRSDLALSSSITTWFGKKYLRFIPNRTHWGLSLKLSKKIVWRIQDRSSFRFCSRLVRIKILWLSCLRRRKEIERKWNLLIEITKIRVIWGRDWTGCSMHKEISNSALKIFWKDSWLSRKTTTIIVNFWGK